MNKQRRSNRLNALDDLLPGPPEPETAVPVEHAPRPRPRRQVGRNALDDLLPGPDPAAEPAPRLRRGRSARSALATKQQAKKVWVSLEIPADVMDAVRGATAALSGSPIWMTMGDLAERALRTEVERLAAEHNRGRPFPRAPGDH